MSVPFVVDLVTDENVISAKPLCMRVIMEDQYGVVQKDIPKILEAMVRFLGEVD